MNLTYLLYDGGLHIYEEGQEPSLVVAAGLRGQLQPGDILKCPTLGCQVVAGAGCVYWSETPGRVLTKVDLPINSHDGKGNPIGFLAGLEEYTWPNGKVINRLVLEFADVRLHIHPVTKEVLEQLGNYILAAATELEAQDAASNS